MAFTLGGGGGKYEVEDFVLVKAVRFPVDGGLSQCNWNTDALRFCVMSQSFRSSCVRPPPRNSSLVHRTTCHVGKGRGRQVVGVMSTFYS